MNEAYRKKKEAARHQAKCIELYLEIHTASKRDLEKIHDYLEKLAKQAGLVNEFKAEHYL